MGRRSIYHPVCIIKIIFIVLTLATDLAWEHVQLNVLLVVGLVVQQLVVLVVEEVVVVVVAHVGTNVEIDA